MKFIEMMSKLLSDVNVVLDIGSRWGQDSLILKNLFPAAKIYAFECTPFSIEHWKENVDDEDIILVEKAACDFTGETKFYVNNADKTITPHPHGNQGANSLFKANHTYPYETYIQDEIVVPCTTISDWAAENNIKKIDVVWMDIQGAELEALKGMGSLIKTIRDIHLEVEFRPVYLGQPLFDEIDEFLKEFGFKFVCFEYKCSWFGDANYTKL